MIYIYIMHASHISLSLGLQTETIHQTFLRRFAPSWHSQDPGNPQRWTPCPSAWRTHGRTCGHWWCLSLGIIISWVKNRTTKQILRRHPKIAGSKFLISVWQSAWLFSFLSFQAGSVIIAPSNILETAASACLCHHRSSPKWPVAAAGRGHKNQWGSQAWVIGRCWSLGNMHTPIQAKLRSGHQPSEQEFELDGFSVVIVIGVISPWYLGDHH